jgi:hypothetical protein
MDWKDFEVFPNDPRVGSQAGIASQHAGRLCAFAQGQYRKRSLLILVRGANPESLQFQGRPSFFPKPVSVKDKTGERGRVKRPGVRYYSDYDLQGVYERRHTGDYQRFFVSNPPKGAGATSAPDPLAASNFLNCLNAYVCPGLNLFQHGPNDDYFHLGPTGPVANNELRDDETFLVFEPTGRMYLLPSTKTLQDYYESRALAWKYRRR